MFEIKEEDVAAAEVIVSGGRGMRGSENFGLLQQLADELGGVVGCSRAAVEAGWMPAERGRADWKDRQAKDIYRLRYQRRYPASGWHAEFGCYHCHQPGQICSHI